LLRPRIGVQHAPHAHGHQVLVLGEDRRHPVPGGMRGLGRHPVHAVVGEQVDVLLPALAVEDVGLAVEELLDRVLGGAVRRFRGTDRLLRRLLLRHHCPVVMYCDHAFIWLRIGASEVPQSLAVSTMPSRSRSRPWWRWKLTQSPPSDDRPWCAFQKFSRSSALISVAGEFTRL